MKEFDKLIEIIQTLHSPKGCPWDRAQKLPDYKRFLLEEVYELVEAIDSGSIKHIQEELGDVFLILSSICQGFAEKNKFKTADVLNSINHKLITRHPHVFGSRKIKSKKEVLAFWVKNKAEKKNRKTIKDRLPLTAPALLMAEIFLKECGYLNEIKILDRQARARLCKKQLFQKVKQLIFHGRTKKLLIDILMEICCLAYIERYELETLLRRRILNLSAKIPYKK